MTQRKIESIEAYKCLDGFYYSVGIRIPCKEDGDMDESKTFFKIEKVEGMN